jgi:hypothetical protein
VVPMSGEPADTAPLPPRCRPVVAAGHGCIAGSPNKGSGGFPLHFKEKEKEKKSFLFFIRVQYKSV